MSITTLWLFVLASAAVVVVPGPTVTVIVANSLSRGTRAGLLNVLGTQLGLLLMIGVLALGFAAIVGRLAVLFDIIRIVGAVYLVWLGWKLWRADGALVRAAVDEVSVRGGASYVVQGFLVIWSNPKALFFFGAFIPQFVDPEHAAAPQVLLLGLLFMAVATVLDAVWAVLAGRAAGWLGGQRVRYLEKLSGTCLVGGGAWLLLAGGRQA